MADFNAELKRTCEALVKQKEGDPDLCARVTGVTRCCSGEPTADSRKFLAEVKQVLSLKLWPDERVLLKFLVAVYLRIGNKNAAKKVLSSHLQGLEPWHKEFVLQVLCQRVLESCGTACTVGSSSQSDVRHIVDMFAALMDNFPLGETCVSTTSSSAMVFLAKAQDYFYQLFRQGGQSAVQANAVMHDCHVTMQTLNRLTQRHLPRGEELMPPLSHLTLAHVMQTDVFIMLEDHMMIDCRCCCAISLVLLLQTFAPDFVPQFINTTLGLERAHLEPPDWLAEVQWRRLELSVLPPMASLALLWGIVSMLDVNTLTAVTSAPRHAHWHSVSHIGGNILSTSNEMIDVSKCGATEIPEVPLKDANIPETDSGTDVTRDVEMKETVPMETGAEEGGRSRPGEGGGGGEVCLVMEALLGELLGIDEKCVSTGSRVQCIKTVTLWTSRIRSCLKESAVSSSMRRRLQGEGQAVKQLLSYVWTHWHDQLDVIRQNSRIIFDNCLGLHTLASECEEAGQDPFLLSLLDHALALDWGSGHCKFSSLASLVALVGVPPILSRHPHFPSTLLTQMVDQAMACHASELYEALIGSDKGRGGSTADGGGARIGGWLSVWIDPIITGLCSTDRKLKQNIIEYMLPKVMKKDKTVLEYMLSRLSSAQDTGVEHLGALIVCLRRARAWGLQMEGQHSQDCSAPTWTKVLSALSSSQEQVRLDAFALLCENKRTAETLSRVELDHVRFFIANNLNNQTPAFRQAMLSFCKKLLFRINESQQAMLRQVKRKQTLPGTTAALQNYTAFLSWLEGFLFSQLYPSSAFARRTISLAMLVLLSQQVQGDEDPSGYRPLRGVGVNHVHTLLECLTDTFEENKDQAFRLLLACTSQCPALLGEELCGELYRTAMQLAISTRPQDCGTAAYLFRLLLHQPHAVSVMPPSGCLPDGLLSHPGQGEGGLQLSGDLASGEREAGEETGLAPDTQFKEGAPVTDTEVCRLMAEMQTSGGGTSATLCLLRSLLVLLADQVAVAQTSLILAAANRPIYPTLHCIRHILDGISFKSLTEEERSVWAKFVDWLLNVCLQVASVVSPVVQNSSPEGNVPEEAVLGPGLQFNLGLMAEVEESRQTVALMPEYLVVCCWRSIKEVSLLLGQLCLNLPVTQPEEGQGLLSFQQMERVGAYFKHQLMESLHRGAFELAYAGFVMMCQRLWKSPWCELQTLPRRWLEEVMSAIMATGDASSALCATRRSAGVPFFIQAIVATETTSSGRPSFHTAMGQLLNIALSSVPSSQPANTDAQVHSLNVLRALFKDTRLGEDVAVYISNGLKAAILGFKSQFWEVRNSATLLLSALMTRIFGVKRSKDESVLSKRNSQTGRAFFHKYPALYPFLLEELEMATRDMGSSGQLHLHPSLYPVLMVLGRLFPSTMEGSATCLNLAAFVPHVIRCSSSPVYKTRMMAARALQPLVGKEQLTSVLTSLLTSLPTRPPPSDLMPPHSHVHGLLLQVYHLVSLSVDMTDCTRQALVSVCLSGWRPLTWLISRQNPCLCTRKVALDITDLILANARPFVSSLASSEKHDLDATMRQLRLVLTQEVWPPPSPPYSPHTPFLSEMMSGVARLAIEYLCVGGEEVVLRLLEFVAYEVHLAVLDWLLDHWADGKSAAVDDVGESDGGSCQQDAGNGTTGSAAGRTSLPMGSSDSDQSRGNGAHGVAMTTAVVDRLLAMGLQAAAHPETVMKIFQLLSLPSVHTAVRSRVSYGSVFEQLLVKLQKERRADVKGKLIQFSGSLLPCLYNDLKHDEGRSDSQTLQLLRTWSQVLSCSCDAEQPDDLHLSCARVLRENCEYLLEDREGCLGLLVFDFWTSLVTLLQADDLEVKDVAASVSSKFGASGIGGSHPEQALGELIVAMFRLHGNTKLKDCVVCALRWVMPRAADVNAGSERLFDKGELNTFQDGVWLSRVVSHCLRQVFTREATSGGEEHHVPVLPPTSLAPSPRAAESASSLWSDGQQELTTMVQNVVELTEKGFGLSAAERDSVETAFLRGAVYCERSVFLIRLGLLVHDLQNLPEFWSQDSERLRGLCQMGREWVKGEVTRPASRGFLLGMVKDSL